MNRGKFFTEMNETALNGTHKIFIFTIRERIEGIVRHMERGERLTMIRILAGTQANVRNLHVDLVDNKKIFEINLTNFDHHLRFTLRRDDGKTLFYL